MLKYFRLIWIVLLLTIGLKPAFSQADRIDFSRIDDLIKKIQKKEAVSIETLAEFIAHNSMSDLEKVRAIYTWISANIEYDIQSYKIHRITDQTPVSVFSSRLAVCQGYSELFRKLCLLNNVHCEVIVGYSKGYGYRPGKKFKTTDHAWNAVKIAGKWHLVDATWGAGYINENNDYIRVANEVFFLSDPQLFIYKHLPTDPMWQLLPCPITIDVFEKDSIQIKNIIGDCKTKAYSDTLRSWEKMDSLQKIVNSNMRSIRYNPENNEPKYKMGWFYYTKAWERMNKLNDPNFQRDLSKAKPMAQEAIYFLNESLKYMNMMDSRDKTYSKDVAQKKSSILINLKNLEKIAQ